MVYDQDNKSCVSIASCSWQFRFSQTLPHSFSSRYGSSKSMCVPEPGLLLRFLGRAVQGMQLCAAGHAAVCCFQILPRFWKNLLFINSTTEPLMQKEHIFKINVCGNTNGLYGEKPYTYILH